MTTRNWQLAFVVLALGVAAGSARAAGAEAPAVQVTGSDTYKRVKIATRPGVTQPFELKLPAEPKAVVLFFPGGEGLGGNIGLDRGLLARGIAFALLSPPSDLPRGFSHGGRRSDNAHANDVAAVIGFLRAEVGRPVWLMGISMGSVSVANAATSGKAPVDGAVFLSPVTARNASGRRPFGDNAVTDFPLRELTVPVLAVVHQRDGCATTPPSGADAILRAAKRARVKELKRFDGGFEASRDPCSGTSYHTFGGLRDEVGAAVADFILANLPE